MRQLARRWQERSATFGRLRFAAKFDVGRLQICEARAVPAVVKSEGWDEPGIGIALRVCTIRPPIFRETAVTIAAIGQHALARRYQRAAAVDDAAILGDLFEVVRRGEADAHGFSAAVPSGGAWRGERAEGGEFLVRTFIG